MGVFLWRERNSELEQDIGQAQLQLHMELVVQN
jgi:hypothetical protein